MSARARSKIVELARSSNVNTKFVIEMFDLFLEAVKEECCSGELKWEPITGWIDPLKPLTQGYTVEQWQEIIDGGYLCQTRDFETKPWVPTELLAIDGNSGSEFIDNCGDAWQFCRPAQIKGVMRPIFVEPVDKEAMCVFFNNQAKWSYLCECKFSELDILSHKKYATKYIEL